jgi:hypothetical protein
MCKLYNLFNEKLSQVYCTELLTLNLQHILQIGKYNSYTLSIEFQNYAFAMMKIQVASYLLLPLPRGNIISGSISKHHHFIAGFTSLS